MIDIPQLDVLLIFLVGMIVLAGVVINDISSRLGQSPLAGFILLGVLLRYLDNHWPFLDQAVLHAIEFLAVLGIVALLFKVGLESHPDRLLKKMPSALPVWIGGVIFTGVAGFCTAHYLLGVAIVPSILVAIAFTATSVGVTVAIWEDAGALDSDTGYLLIDVAELDDISGIALMALLFAVVPVLLAGDGQFWSLLGQNMVVFLVKFTLFIVMCLLFVHFIEHRVTHFLRRLNRPPQRMLVVASVGFLIAAFAGWLGFSLAIGALFAGLVFSRDPDAVKTEISLEDLYAFVTPFFFISIGLHINPASLGDGLGIGLVLAFVAVVTKIIGHGVPALFVTSGAGALLLGVSMVPRAEIAMVIMQQGHAIGPDIVPDAVYSGMIIMSLVTCLITPFLVKPMLKKYNQE